MKVINSAKFAAFLETLPEHLQHECFEGCGDRYDIAKALFLVQQFKLKIKWLDVKKWCKALDMDGPEQQDSMKINLLTGVDDVSAMLPSVNPDIPVIIAEHTYREKGTNQQDAVPILIDGNKRLRKAFLTGIDKPKVYRLEAKLAKLAKLARSRNIAFSPPRRILTLRG